DMRVMVSRVASRVDTAISARMTIITAVIHLLQGVVMVCRKVASIIIIRMVATKAVMADMICEIVATINSNHIINNEASRVISKIGISNHVSVRKMIIAAREVTVIHRSGISKTGTMATITTSKTAISRTI